MLLRHFIKVLFLVQGFTHAFYAGSVASRSTAVRDGWYTGSRRQTVFMAQISENEARTSIDKVVAALRKDKSANTELGRLEKVTTILGFGSPTPGSIAVRFNASFRKAGMGRQAIPMPFMLGQTTKSEGRGTMVGQVKASVDASTGKVTSCSVFRDLGYGRSFDLKC